MSEKNNIKTNDRRVFDINFPGGNQPSTLAIEISEKEKYQFQKEPTEAIAIRLRDEVKGKPDPTSDIIDAIWLAYENGISRDEIFNLASQIEKEMNDEEDD